MRSDGSTAKYYELPEGCTQLQDLISHRNMNGQIAEIFRACYRYGLVEHSEMLRDAKKIKFYAEAEIKRLKKLSDPNIGEAKGADGSVFSWKINPYYEKMASGEKMDSHMPFADLGAHCSKPEPPPPPPLSSHTRYSMPDGGYVDIKDSDVKKSWFGKMKHCLTGTEADTVYDLARKLYRVNHQSLNHCRIKPKAPPAPPIPHSKPQPQLPDGYTRYDMPDGGWVAYRNDSVVVDRDSVGVFWQHEPTGVRIYPSITMADGSIPGSRSEVMWFGMAVQLYKIDHPSIIKYTPT